MEELLPVIAHHLALIIEGLALLVIAGGVIIAVLRALVHRVRHGTWMGSYEDVRKGIGRTLLIALEFLLAAEIARSIMAGETLNAALTLGLVVVVRTFLSIAIEMEISGRWPWRSTEARGEPSNASEL